MTSFQKVEEAKFFLGLVNDHYQDDDKCQYCLSAFLHATYDLIDHTLEEYQLHFQLNLPFTTKPMETFVEIAMKNGNKDAVGFMKIFVSSARDIYTDPLSAPLFVIRNTNTHNHMNLTPFSTFTEDSTGKRYFDKRYFLADHDIGLGFFREDLNGYVNSKCNLMNRLGKRLGTEVPIASQAEFDDVYAAACQILSTTDVRKVCKKHLDSLDRFVNTLRTKYPRW